MIVLLDRQDNVVGQASGMEVWLGSHDGGDGQRWECCWLLFRGKVCARDVASFDTDTDARVEQLQVQRRTAWHSAV
jgi:hypothetical protein